MQTAASSIYTSTDDYCIAQACMYLNPLLV